MRSLQRPLRVLTWHIHGSYLYYLSQCKNIDFFIPYKSISEEGYIGKTENFPWPENIYEVPTSYVKKIQFDCIIFQSKKNYLHDQYEILSPTQQLLPKIYIEHDPPREHPTDTKHIVNDHSITIVHVTHFNNVMWNNNNTPTTVIEHGVNADKSSNYIGDFNKGIVVINNLPIRGRRLGLDIFLKIRKHIPLDLVGMNSEQIGGLGEIPYTNLLSFISHYRFYFSPIRYTSLGLSIAEAMTIGMPIVGLDTTEMSRIFTNGKNGIINNNLSELIIGMKSLLNNKEIANRLGENAKKTVNKKFNISTFTFLWEKLITKTVQNNFYFPNNITQNKII